MPSHPSYQCNFNVARLCWILVSMQCSCVLMKSSSTAYRYLLKRIMSRGSSSVAIFASIRCLQMERTVLRRYRHCRLGWGLFSLTTVCTLSFSIFFVTMWFKDYCLGNVYLLVYQSSAVMFVLLTSSFANIAMSYIIWGHYCRRSDPLGCCFFLACLWQIFLWSISESTIKKNRHFSKWMAPYITCIRSFDFAWQQIALLNTKRPWIINRILLGHEAAGSAPPPVGCLCSV